MVIVAHPDDADFGPAARGPLDRRRVAGLAGVLHQRRRRRRGPFADPLALAAIRETEQDAAAAIVGYAGVISSPARRALANDLALREQAVREIRTFAGAVFATDPDTLFYKGGGINHTDHRAAGMAAVDAVYPAARNPMAFPSLARSGLAAHRVRRLYLFWSERSDVRLDISATLDRKIDALRAHATQIHDPDGLETRIREWAAEEGAALGVVAAEAFRVIVIDDDEDEGPG
jgi:LmbE family N-acetylglucosaminyl deacetylase